MEKSSSTKKAAKSRTPTNVQSNEPVKFASPGESGKGYPYAPVDWPNPGDIWGWRVGKRIRHDGVYKDRFLIGPERLQEKPTKQLNFASKVSVQRYIETYFPGSDVNAFFSSFIWEIPADQLTPNKENLANVPLVVTPISQVPASYEKDITNEENGETSRTEEKATPKRKSRATNAVYAEDDMPLEEEVEEEPPTKKGSGKTLKKTPEPNTGKKKSPATSSTKRGSTGNSKDVSPEDKGTPKKIPVSRGRAAAVPPGYDESRTPIKCKPEIQDLFDESQEGLTHEDFDGYVNSLDEMLASPFLRAESSSSVNTENITMADAREKLSSLLAMGLPNLASSNKLNELVALSAKVRNDPNLRSSELSMLNLIQEVTPICNRFKEARGISVQAAKFFADLESKTAKIAELRSEYSGSKDDMEVLQAEEASVMTDISELEQQIASLQARRQQMTQTIKSTNKKIVHFTSVQRKVIDSLPVIVREIQMANSDKHEWEAKKKIAGEYVAEILEKYGPLGEFSF